MKTIIEIMQLKKLVSRSLHWYRKKSLGDLSTLNNDLNKDDISKEISGNKEERIASSVSYLEKLPAELKVLILRNCPDVTTLKALTLSSPSYYHTYLDQRRVVLSNVIHNTLQPSLFFEVFSVFEALRFQEDEGSISRVSEIKAFLLKYHEAREKGIYPSTILELEVLVPIAQFQLKIEAIVKHYCQPILAGNPLTRERQTSSDAITISEVSRLYRGLYRFELFCLLFGERKYDLEDDDWGVWARGFNVLTISRLYLSKLTAWEVEEIVCVGKYILDTYDRILGDCGDLDPEQQQKEFQRQRLKSGMSGSILH